MVNVKATGTFFLLILLALAACLMCSAKNSQTIDLNELDWALSNVVVDEYSHAMEEHPDTAPMVHDCFSTKGAYMTFQVEKNKRYLRVCLIDEYTGLIGFQIVDIVGRIAKEKTAYIKENLRCIKDMLNYVQRMGYPRYTKPL